MSRFHQLYVLEHPLFAHDTCRARIVLMPVHTPQFDGFTIDQQLAVFYPDRPKSETMAQLLRHSAVG